MRVCVRGHAILSNLRMCDMNIKYILSWNIIDRDKDIANYLFAIDFVFIWALIGFENFWIYLNIR